jgi:hypothetical protein
VKGAEPFPFLLQAHNPYGRLGVAYHTRRIDYQNAGDRPTR